MTAAFLLVVLSSSSAGAVPADSTRALRASARAQDQAITRWDHGFDLSTIEGQVELLMTAQTLVPTLFTASILYDRPLTDIMQTQRNIEYELANNQRLAPELAILNELHAQTNGNLLRMEISRGADQSVRVLSRSAFAEFREKLTQAMLLIRARMIKDRVRFTQALLSEIADLSRRPDMTWQGLMTGMLLTIEDRAQRRLPEGTIDEKLDYLRSHVAKDAGGNIASSFDFARFGYTQAPTVESLITRIREGFLAQPNRAMLIPLIQAGVIAATEDSSKLTWRKANKKINEVNEGTLDLMKDQDSLNERVTWLTGANAVALRTLTNAKNEVRASVLRLLGQTDVVNQRGSSLTLIEMPPSLGVFRGFVGGDCSTERSIAYPFIPTERVFFVFDSANSVKGYVQGTVVLVNGKKSFYLHTMNGPRISGADTVAIIEAMNKNVWALKVDSVTLPTVTMTSAFINYPEIISGYEKVRNQGNQPVFLSYLDPQTRAVLSAHNKHAVRYDQPELNGSGFVLPAAVASDPSIRISRVEIERADASDRLASVMLALGLVKTEKADAFDMAELALKPHGLNLDQLDRLRGLLADRESLAHELTAEQFIDSIFNQLRSMGVTLSQTKREEFITTNATLFAPGIVESKPASVEASWQKYEPLFFKALGDEDFITALTTRLPNEVARSERIMSVLLGDREKSKLVSAAQVIATANRSDQTADHVKRLLAGINRHAVAHILGFSSWILEAVVKQGTSADIVLLFEDHPSFFRDAELLIDSAKQKIVDALSSTDRRPRDLVGVYLRIAGSTGDTALFDSAVNGMFRLLRTDSSLLAFIRDTLFEDRSDSRSVRNPELRLDSAARFGRILTLLRNSDPEADWQRDVWNLMLSTGSRVYLRHDFILPLLRAGYQPGIFELNRVLDNQFKLVDDPTTEALLDLVMVSPKHSSVDIVVITLVSGDVPASRQVLIANYLARNIANSRAREILTVLTNTRNPVSPLAVDIARRALSEVTPRICSDLFR